MERLIKKGFSLYRLDLTEPPKEWKTEHKSTLYSYTEEGPKNSISAFYFYSSINEVVNYDIMVKQNFNERIDRSILEGSHWLTETKTTDDIKMLDLTGVNSVKNLCKCLHNARFDIFTKDFWHRPPLCSGKRMSEKIDEVEQICNNNGTEDIISYLINNMCMFFDWDYDKPDFSYLMQELTDFTNGIYFKKQLQENGCEGYIFNEYGFTTYCFLESIKLKQPKHSILCL